LAHLAETVGCEVPAGMIRISDAEFDRVAEEALAEIPEEFQQYLENVVIEVRPRPDAALLRQHEVPPDVLGLYIGRPLEEQGPEMMHAAMPDRILIFRDNLRRACRTRAELIEEIRVTVLHEIGHHFGLDEDRLEDLGYA
jgi:predicted Zn-dependent protease with MMP-like domain